MRVSALGIAAADAPSPVEAVRRLLAMQAQDFAGALWSIGLRVPGATVVSVEDALTRGEIVRSWPMRGTLHFVVAEDLGWMLGLTGQRMVRAADGRRRQLGLEAADFAHAEKLIRAELSGGRSATRSALMAALEAGGHATTGQRGVHTLVQLAQTGVLVQSSKDVWWLLEEWVTAPRRLEPDEALREFALRYALGHGPVSARDFAWWSSLTLSDARRGLAAASDELEQLVVDDETYYLRPGLAPAPRAVHLLPGFDEFVLGYTDRTPQLPATDFMKVVPGGNGVFLPTIVVDGQVIGTWKRDRATAKKWTYCLTPFAGSLDAATLGAVNARLERYSDFLDVEVVLAN
ncbi:winged helix DNA-binding domain-containing protein [soil metagenome]